MIDFPCICGHRFRMADDEAGGMVQCPACKRLVDVPTPGTLKSIDDDGTIRMDIPLKPDEEEPDRMAELKRAYLPRRQDENGKDFDLRVTMEQIELAGVDEVPLELKDEQRPGAPKYDPESGELIRPMKLKGEEAKPVIPVGPPKATLQYARALYAEGEVGPWQVPVELFKPGNMAVWGALVVAHALAMLLWIVMGGGLVIAILFLLFVYMMTLAHVSNVVEEIGHAGRDELPAPLRGMDFADDIWKPCVNVAGSLMLCYLPAFFALNPRTWVVSAALWLAGSFVFPAVLLTLATSGTAWNLRPDRVLRVIGASGGSYLFCVGMWLVGSGLYGAGLFGTTEWSLTRVYLAGSRKLTIDPWLALGMLMGSFYFLHWFCWRLGLVYREHHEKFPWILQQHTRSTKWQEYADRRRPPKPAQPASGVRVKGQPQQARPVEALPVQPIEAKPVQPVRNEERLRELRENERRRMGGGAAWPGDRGLAVDVSSWPAGID